MGGSGAEVGGTKLPLAITVAEHPTFGPLGAIDIPMQSLEGFPTMVTKGEAGELDSNSSRRGSGH